MPGLEDVAVPQAGPAWIDEVRKYGGADVAKYVGRKTAAGRLLIFETILIPGSLQTKEYATAVLRKFDTDAESVRRKAEFRTRPGASLSDPEVHVVLLQEVFERQIGGWETMRGQVEHLIEQSRRPKIVIRILEYGAGAHSGVDGPFTVFVPRAEQEAPSLGHAEHALGHAWRGEKPGEDMATLADRFGELERDAAEVPRSHDIMRMYLGRYAEQSPN